jgi:hypothetical protein
MNHRQTRNAKRKIACAHHRIKALKLREQGLCYREIGAKLGVTEQRAWKMVSQEFDRLNEKRTEQASNVQRLEISRLDEMLKGIWAKAKAGNFQAINSVLAIMTRRARLLGLDLADKQTATQAGPVVLNIEEMIVEHRGQLNGQADTAAPGPKRLSHVEGPV